MENDFMNVYNSLLNTKQLIDDYDNVIKMWKDVLTDNRRSEKERIQIVVSRMEIILKRSEK